MREIEIDPNYERAYPHRAKNYNRQGNTTDACKDFNSSITGDSWQSKSLTVIPTPAIKSAGKEVSFAMPTLLFAGVFGIGPTQRIPPVLVQF